jgi:hypothetical protein
MEKVKRIFISVLGTMLLISFLLWLIPWLRNGGWPSSEPAGNSLPPNIEYVMPGDGEALNEAYGFCVHFNYLAGHSMNKESQETSRYFFDGRNVTKNTYDLISLEYPTQVAEPCYKQSEPLSPGWHTAKVTYKDNAEERFDYMWRFQVIEDE